MHESVYLFSYILSHQNLAEFTLTRLCVRAYISNENSGNSSQSDLWEIEKNELKKHAEYPNLILRSVFLSWLFAIAKIKLK